MTIITRSALVHWRSVFGIPARQLKPDLHSIVDGQVVTWADVMEARRKRQADRLALKRMFSPWRCFRITVAHFDQWCMGGWQSHIDDLRGPSRGSWIDRDRSWLKPIIMQVFPLVLAIGTEDQQWEAWKVSFAKQFRRGHHDHKPRGVAFVWWNERDAPRPVVTRLETAHG